MEIEKIDDNNTDLSKVVLDKNNKPTCTEHGAMNKVSKVGLWRCLGGWGNCRAGCIIRTQTNSLTPLSDKQYDMD